MLRRPINQKLRDIKSIRVLTNFLSKIGIDECTRSYDSTSWGGTFTVIRGLGLAEAKAYVEKKYIYFEPSSETTNLAHVRAQNHIAKIKAMRVFAMFLRDIGLQSPDTGLYFAKHYADKIFPDWNKPD